MKGAIHVEGDGTGRCHGETDMDPTMAVLKKQIYTTGVIDE